MNPTGESVAAATPPSLARHWRRFNLVVLVVAAAVAYRGLAMSAPLRSTIPAVERFFFHPSQNAPDVTLLAMVALLLADWRRLSAQVGRSRPSLLAGSLLPFALGLHLWSVHTQALQVDLLSLGCFLLGSAGVLGGWPLVRMVLLPTSLLLVAIPIPVVLINQLVLPLQAGTIALTTFFLDVLGREYFNSGDIIYSGGRAFQVIDTCTGLRSISTMMMATLVYIRVFHKRGWHAGLLLALAAPISFAFNGVRVLVIIFSAEMTLAEDHTIQGIAVMIASVLALHAVAQGVDRVWPAAPWTPASRSRNQPGRDWRVATVFGVVACLLAGGFWVEPWKATPELSSWQVKMPTEYQGYQARMVQLDEDYLGSVEFDRHLQRRYERGGGEDGASQGGGEGEPGVEVLIGMQRRVGRDQSLLSKKLGLPGAGQVLLGESAAELPEIDVPARLTLTRGPGGVVLNYSWFRGTAGFAEELVRAFFALDRSELHREGGAYALRVSTPVRDPSDLPAASERLRHFALFVDALVPRPPAEDDAAS